MRRTSAALIGLALFGGLLGLLAERASAIPAFARTYSLSCSTCHAPFPRLNGFGEAFAGRGFRMPDPSAEPESATRQTGDPKLALPATLPLAVRMEGHVAAKEEGEADLDFESPWVFKLLSGGPLSPKLSYYAYFIIEQGGVEGLEDAYLHVHELFGRPVDLLFGQFQVSDPLFKRELRLERSDYEIYRVRIGEARANLTYDRGLMLFGTLPGEIDTTFQIVNGNGIPEGEFDNDSKKNFALRLSREFGPVRAGLFGYLGDEEGETSPHADRIVYFGPDLTIGTGGNWEVNLQYLERSDDDPYFLGPGAAEHETRGGFAEVHFFPQGQQGDWVISALYNRIESDDPSAERDDAAIAVNYLWARNVRVLAEAAHDLEADDSRLSLGLVTAF